MYTQQKLVAAKRSHDLYRVLQQPQDWTNTLALPRLLEKYGNRSSESFAKYSVEPVLMPTDGKLVGHHEEWLYKAFPSSGANRKHYELWMDAPMGLLLKYKGQPAAVVAFVAQGDGQLLVIQNHGLRPKIFTPEGEYLKTQGSKGLGNMDVHALMFHLAANLAKQTGMREIVIQGGANNRWTRPNRDALTAHISVEQARSVYDRGAKLLGGPAAGPAGELPREAGALRGIDREPPSKIAPVAWARPFRRQVGMTCDRTRQATGDCMKLSTPKRVQELRKARYERPKRDLRLRF